MSFGEKWLEKLPDRRHWQLPMAGGALSSSFTSLGGLQQESHTLSSHPTRRRKLLSHNLIINHLIISKKFSRNFFLNSEKSFHISNKSLENQSQAEEHQSESQDFLLWLVFNLVLHFDQF